MGGLAQGLADAGFLIAWASDHNPSAVATFAHRFPQVRVIEKDIRSLRVRSDHLDPVDILVGAFPCQSFSAAGDRRGFDDPRGQLFSEIPRIIREFGPRPPKLVLLENVPNILGGGGGRWFDRIRRELREAGYWFRRRSCWKVNVKDVTSIPQDRRRVLMVAASRRHFPNNSFSADRFLNARQVPQRLAEFIDSSRKAPDDHYLDADNRYCKMIFGAMGRGDSRKNIYQLRRSYPREKKDGLCPTLTANMGGGGHNVPFVEDEWGVRKLTVGEVARLQGFSNPEHLFPDGLSGPERYRLIGNAVCPGLARVAASECRHMLERISDQ